MPVTDQVPYGKPTTEALGWPAVGPANKRLAMAREEYLLGNWLKRARKINWKIENDWRLEIINRINKNVIDMVYSSYLIALEKYLNIYRKNQLSRQVPYGKLGYRGPRQTGW